jgi:CHAD domain-containing protein
MFRFEPNGASVEEQFRQIARDLVTRAIEDLEADERDIGDTIHRLRRYSKKLRGLFQLVRPVFDDFARENAAVRDASATLAHARDADVIVQTIERLAEIRPGEAEQLRRIRDALAAQQHATVDPLALGPYRDAFLHLGERVSDWTLDAKGWKALGPGLERTYRIARRRMKDARRSGSAIDHHEWRKANKHHGFHIELLGNLARDVLTYELKVTERLSEHLGRHHDLDVLRQRMERDDEAFGGAEDRACLSRAVDEERTALEEKAHALGQQINAEEPADLAARYAAYWRLHEH